MHPPRTSCPILTLVLPQIRSSCHILSDNCSIYEVFSSFSSFRLNTKFIKFRPPANSPFNLRRVCARIIKYVVTAGVHGRSRETHFRKNNHPQIPRIKVDINQRGRILPCWTSLSGSEACRQLGFEFFPLRSWVAVLDGAGRRGWWWRTLSSWKSPLCAVDSAGEIKSKANFLNPPPLGLN